MVPQTLNISFVCQRYLGGGLCCDYRRKFCEGCKGRAVARNQLRTAETKLFGILGGLPLFQQLENVVIVVQPFLSLQRATSFYVLNILEQSITLLSAYGSCDLLSTSLLRAKTCTYMYVDLKIFLCQTWSIMRNTVILVQYCLQFR